MRARQTSLADHGGGADEPRRPTADELDELDRAIRGEAAELYAADPGAFPRR